MASQNKPTQQTPISGASQPATPTEQTNPTPTTTPTPSTPPPSTAQPNTTTAPAEKPQETTTPSTTPTTPENTSGSGQSTPTTPAPSSPSPTGVGGSWTLTFSDDFSGSSLDLNKWSNCWFSPTCGTMNNVTTSPSNVAVSNGNLVLTLASSSSGALVSTNPNGGATTGYQFTYGVVEARMYLPGNGSQCYNWAGFWTDGQTWPANGEHDIAEILGGEVTVNYHSSSGAHNQGAVPGYWCGGYHTYTLHRQVGKSDVYYDGTLVKTYTTDDGGSPHYIILNVGNSSPSAYGASSQVKVDYVRSWQ